MESEDHLFIPEEIEHNAMMQTFESKRGEEDIPEQIVINNDKENLIPIEETKGAILVGPITTATANAMHSKLSLLKKKIDSNNTMSSRAAKTSSTSAYVSAQQ